MHRIDSWDELKQTIKGLKQELSNPNEIWFRGQGNANYTLLPSLFRNQKNIDKEESIFRLYKQISQKLSPNRMSDWETLFDMQHYYAPTRLLDWSENLGISLFFAVNYRTPGVDAALYLLDPLRLNSEYTSKERIPIVPDDSDEIDYIQNYIKKKPYPPVFPIAIRPNFINDRMTAQRGAFTIHGNDLSPIEELCANAVKKIVISEKAFPEIFEFFEYANINEYTVFPDMSGVSQYIRNRLLE
jgi:FRG domain